MTSDWKEYKLSELSDIKGGKRLPARTSLIQTKTTHPYIRVRDLTNKKILELTSEFEYVDDETQNSIRKYIVNEGDVIISIVGTVGLVAIIGKTLDNANLTENCAKFINLKKIDNHFLYYYLISEFGQQEIKKNSVGAVQTKLPLYGIGDIKINLPPLSAQQKIVKVLSAIDDKIELNNKINKNLEQQAQAIFKSWFIDFEPFGNTMPDDWKNGTFSSIIDHTISGDWGKDKLVGNNTEMVYCVRGADIPEVRNGNKGKMPFRYILPKNYYTKKLTDGDLVVEISGGSPTQSTGRIAVITKHLLQRYDKDMICTNFCKAIKPKKNYSMFIYYYWLYLYRKNVFFSYENGTTGIKNLDINGFIETEPIIIPNVKNLLKFSELCLNIESEIFANGYENEKLIQLRNTLLLKLMSGEIDVENVEIDEALNNSSTDKISFGENNIGDENG